MRSPLQPMAAVPVLCLVSACSGVQSALDPHGPQAEHLTRLFWIFAAVCSAIWLAVMLVLLVAVLRRTAERPDPLRLEARAERRSVKVVGAAVLATLLTVIALTAVSYLSQRQLFARGKAS